MAALLAPVVDMLPMSVSDVDEILPLEYRAYAYPWSRANFTDSLASGYSCWVGRIGGELIGYFVLMMVVDEAHLLNICVSTKYQGVGMGARLLRHAMMTARSAGALSLLLEVRPSNERALILYRHFGFRQIGVRRGYYPAVSGREDALVMSHVLEEATA